jgi:hypothetical protein
MATEPKGTTTPPPPAQPDPWDDGGPMEPAPEHKKKGDPDPKNPWDDGGANKPAPGTH